MSEIIPKITVILPVYNGAAYVRECVDSVLKQSLNDFELIIGDDCSSDDSLEILRSYSDHRITLVCWETNQGLYKNVNKLLKIARAPLIHFLCQDDCAEVNWLEEVVNFYARHPEIGFSFTKAREIDQSSRFIGAQELNDLPEVIKPFLSKQLFFYYGCIVANLSNLGVRKSVFTQMGLFDESFELFNDLEFESRMCLVQNCGVIHQLLLRVRSHTGQLSGSASSARELVVEHVRIRKALFRQLPARSKKWALWYDLLRHNVFYVHIALYNLLKGRGFLFMRSIKVMGFLRFFIGSFFWLITGNNRFFKPRVHIVNE